MIPEFAVLQWRKEAPWNELFQVEQDLIISRALVDLYSTQKIQSNLAFRGGTALNKLFTKPAARYSEDIDLVQIKKEGIGDSINSIREALSWLGEPQRRITERSVKLIYRYEAINLTPKKLKIEINITEHFHIYELEKHEIVIKNPWFEGKAKIVTFSINELMGTKLRALYQRKKGRDLFDLWIAIKNNLIDCNLVIDAFAKYCAKDGINISRAIFEKNFIEKIANQEFQYDINNLINAETYWNFDEAVDLIQNKLIKGLPGEPYKMKEK
ncbi:hypothetical protein NOVO_08425 [Rickettsiales bacterium Ac37b]|nr:hypothetical protein NOVO_08425 [Rickettsiales bacterium Ac37b]